MMSKNAVQTSLVLDVIGLMCDGQNRNLQHYLREQPENFKVLSFILCQCASIFVQLFRIPT